MADRSHRRFSMHFFTDWEIMFDRLKTKQSAMSCFIIIQLTSITSQILIETEASNIMQNCTAQVIYYKIRLPSLKGITSLLQEGVNLI